MNGIIDIGSNSVRIMRVADGFKEKRVITTRLSEGMADGVLQREAIERTVRAIALLAAESGCERLYAYATEAVRSAVNREEFLDAVRLEAGISPEILDGVTEAECSFRGAASAFLGERDSAAAVVDVGGASTEVVIGAANEIIYAKSAPCGIVRVKDNCGEDDTRIDRYLAENLVAVHSGVPKCGRLIGIGGTLSTLAAIAQELEVFDAEKTHGYRLTMCEIVKIAEAVKRTPREERAAIKGLSSSRIDTFYGGAMILLSVMRLLRAESVTVSESDNLEGYALVRGLGI